MIFEKKCSNCAHNDGVDYLHPCKDCRNGSHWMLDRNKVTPNDIRELDGFPRIDNDVVNHPSHYKSKNGIETINVIEAFTEDLLGMEAVDTANVIKYICRWKKKNGIQDLKKAQWYLNDLIKRLEDEEKEIV